MTHLLQKYIRTLLEVLHVGAAESDTNTVLHSLFNSFLLHRGGLEPRKTSEK